MKKVVLIAEAMLGGIRQHVFDIARKLNKEEFQVYLIYSDERADEKFFEEIKEFGKSVELIKCNEMQRSLGWHDVNAYKKIKQLLKGIQPDIVHCHSSKAGVVGRLAAKKCNVPLILYTPNAYAFQSPECSIMKKWLYIWAERYLSRNACSMTINVSKGEMNKALEYKVDKPEKFMLIYNGIPQIDIPDRTVLRSRLALRQDIQYVGFTGRCAKQKDPMTFLKIAKQVISLRDDVEFLYIGDGDLEDSMKEWIEQHQLSEKIHMLGFRNDSAEIVGALDIYLSTVCRCSLTYLPKNEGLPYSMIEAMRAGVPIIATNCIGNNELVFERINGLLFPVRDIESGSKCIISQIENKLISRENAVSTYASVFSVEKMMDSLQRVYRK